MVEGSDDLERFVGGASGSIMDFSAPNELDTCEAMIFELSRRLWILARGVPAGGASRILVCISFVNESWTSWFSRRSLSFSSLLLKAEFPSRLWSMA